MSAKLPASVYEDLNSILQDSLSTPARKYSHSERDNLIQLS